MREGESTGVNNEAMFSYWDAVMKQSHNLWELKQKCLLWQRILGNLFVFVYEFKNENKVYTVAFSSNMQHTLVFISPTYVLHVHAE